MTQTSASAEKLVLRRTFKAPRSRVFAAWTQADLLMQWLRPMDATIIAATTDPRVAGKYTITFQKADGEKLNVFGTYTEVREPERLAFVWRWEEDDPSLEHDTFVTLDFREVGNDTELTLTHENFANTESREGHTEGWSNALEKLPSVL